MPGNESSFETLMRQGGETALIEASRFFMGTDRVHQSLRAITGKLAELKIPYAVAGGMSLVAHGYDRTTEDVDVLVSPDGLKRLHEKLEGLGYVPLFAGSKSLRDVSTGVRIEFLTSGSYPGDGKPKAVAFPDPSEASVEIDGIHYLKLNKLIELKLASGMTNPGRMKDLADVQELIRVLKLDWTFESELDPSVRERYHELWTGVAVDNMWNEGPAAD